MELTIQSSFIKAASYNEGKQRLRLEIGNHWYYYYGVTIQRIYRFRKAVSKGTYYCKFIKGKYKTLKRRVHEK